jgi:hypothetical protein
MNAPTSSPTAEKSLSVESDVEGKLSKLLGENIPKRPPHIEPDVEQITSSIGRFTSNSIDGLQGLTSELQELQSFLNSEVQKIESTLAGIKIIIDTISPWKDNPVSLAIPTSPRSVRAGSGSKY